MPTNSGRLASAIIKRDVVAWLTSRNTCIQIDLVCHTHYRYREPIYIPVEKVKKTPLRCIGCIDCGLGIELMVNYPILAGDSIVGWDWDYSMNYATVYLLDKTNTWKTLGMLCNTIEKK
jgi:hypothetical protein